jgi:hypothetical protein
MKLQTIKARVQASTTKDEESPLLLNKCAALVDAPCSPAVSLWPCRTIWYSQLTRVHGRGFGFGQQTGSHDTALHCTFSPR